MLFRGEAGQQGDNLTIRGFNAQNDFYLDGVRDFGSYYSDPFNLEAVEVMKGPASVLFGRGSSGGTVNQVSKQPRLKSITDATGVMGTDGTFRFNNVKPGTYQIGAGRPNAPVSGPVAIVGCWAVAPAGADTLVKSRKVWPLSLLRAISTASSTLFR